VKALKGAAIALGFVFLAYLMWSRHALAEDIQVQCNGEVCIVQQADLERLVKSNQAAIAKVKELTQRCGRRGA
jgi:cell division protein FtsB